MMISITPIFRAIRHQKLRGIIYDVINIYISKSIF